MFKNIILFIALICSVANAIAQKEFLYTKEGKRILKRESLINNCLRSFHKDKTDATALSICECEINKIDGHFTNSQYRKYSSEGIIDINGLLKSDSLFEKSVEACYTASGKTALMEAEGFENQFVKNCIANIWKDTQKQLDSTKVENFCSCQLTMVKEKKLTDAEMATLSDPNSLLFYEMMYKCGNPFLEKGTPEKSWSNNNKLNIEGPQKDTINILAIDGMNYVKIKIGSLVKVWLLDTGASDMLINKDMETALKSENIISDSNYLGIGEYEMANGSIESCRKYNINSVQIGKFTINNINISVTEKGKRILVGRSLLNKFAHLELDNKTNKLILEQ